MSQSLPPSGHPGVLILRLLRLALLDPLGEDLIEMEGLSLGLRIMTVLGYLTVFGLLACVLLIEVLYNFLPKTSFLGGEKLVEIPIPAVLAACLAFCAGWAFLLTGATDTRKRIFLPIWLFFGLQIFMVMPLGSTFGMAFWCIGGPFVLISMAVIYPLSHRWSGWRSLPLLEFCIWFALFAIFFIGFALSSHDFEHFASNMAGIFSLLAFFSVPFWLFSGATVVDLAVSLAAKITVRLRRALAPDLLHASAIAFTLARPGFVTILLLILYFFAPTFSFLAQAFTVDLGLALLFAVILPFLAAFKRLSTRAAAILFTLDLAAPVFALSLVLTLFNSELDMFEALIGLLAALLPLLIFVFLISHSLLSVGAEFANGDGKIIPRSGRISLVFGASLLVIAFTIFFVNLRYIGTGEYSSNIQELTDSLFSLGAFIFGLPYLAWLIWKKPDELAGAEADFPALETSSKPHRGLAWGGALLGLLFSLGVCGLTVVLDQLMK